MSGARIVAAGDAALVVEFEPRIDPDVNARAIALGAAILQADIPGVRDVVPAYCSTTVYFDPLRADHSRLRATLEREASRSTAHASTTAEPVRIPVCYDAEFGVDLAVVAAFGHVPEDDVVRLHVARTYRVYMLGFVPGFAYLGSVDPRIAIPRRHEPRVRVPAGSVAIAGPQTGVYPSETPGGWQIIGRTPVRLVDMRKSPPFLLKAGDSVRFDPITRAEYARLQASR